MLISRRTTQAPLALVVSLGLLVIAWMMSTPPGSAPDERAHYLRAAAAGYGQIILNERPPWATANLNVADAWQYEQSRMVSIPQSLDPSKFQCWSIPDRLEECFSSPGIPAETVKLSTYVGTYPPALYLVPGLLMRLGSEPLSTLRLGRAALGMISLTFVGVAVFALWDPLKRVRSLLGLICVTTPMVVYTASTLSPSGPEATSSLCFFACVLRIARSGSVPRWVWAALGVSGFTLTVARDLGPLWLALGAALLLGMGGVRPAIARVKDAGRPAAAALALLGLGMVIALLWQLFVQEHPGTGLGTLLAGIVPSFGLLQAIYRQIIGVFGVLDTHMPLIAYVVWALLFGVLGALALWLATLRQRLMLLGIAGGGVVVIAALDAIQMSVGFGAQGRHILPLSIAFGLAAGEIISTSSKPSPRMRYLPLLFAGVASAVHGLGWYSAARRYSVGENGPWGFFAEAGWRPPLGWPLWALVVAVACALLIFALRDVSVDCPLA